MLYDPNWKAPDTTEVPVKRKDLTQDEIKALLWVREGLKTGTIKDKQFEMSNTIDKKKGCGTVGCIAGWMSFYQWSVVEQLSPRSISKKIAEYNVYGGTLDELLGTSKFNHLFHMNDYTPNPDDKPPTPEQGVMAIERFLAGHKRPWGHIEGEDSWGQD